MTPKRTKSKETDKSETSTVRTTPPEPIPASEVVKASKNFFDTATYKAREIKFKNSALKREVARAKKIVEKKKTKLLDAKESLTEARDELTELNEMLAEVQNTESVTGDKTAEELNEED